MLRLVIGVVLVLHGLVYLLYVGQSARVFELRAGLTWPDDSLAFSRLMGNDLIRTLATFAFTVTAIGFVAAGVGVLLSQSWWRPLVGATAVLAILFTLVFWDGRVHRISEQGGIGLLISAAILVSLLVMDWPQLTS